MKKRIFSDLCMVAYTFSLLILFGGCENRPLEDPQEQLGQIPIRIYWDKAEVSPKNATVLFYNETGNLYKEWQSASQTGSAVGTVILPPGRYTAVAFNELRNQINNVHMQDWGKFETFEAFALPNLQPVYDFSSNVEGNMLVRQPGILSACTTSFTVEDTSCGCGTYNLTDSSYKALSDLHPTRKTARVNIIIHVDKLNNARMPALAELRNFASGYIFSTDRNTLTPVTTQFTANNRSYNPGSTTDGTVSTSVNIFGFPGDRFHLENTPGAKLYLDMAFMLADAEQTIVEYSKDVTDLVKVVTDENGGVTINIEIEIGRLPDITPVAGGSGFDTELVDWDKVIIPLQQ